MPTIDNWRALREALDQMFEVCAHLDVWKYREGETNEWGAQCYEIDCETYGIEEIATAYDPETAAYIAAAHPAAIRALLDERDRLETSVEVLIVACKLVIEMNQDTARDKYGDPNKCESWACVRTLRAAIDAAMKGKP